MRRRMMAVAFALIGHGAFAQVPKATAKDTAVRAAIFSQLFSGLSLTLPEKRLASREIGATLEAQEKLLPLNSQSEFDRFVLVQVRRDSILRSLLKDDAARTKFDLNAARMRPKSNVWKS